MDLDQPLDLSSDALSGDFSGTPIFLLEQARRRNDLAILSNLDQVDVLISYPFGERWQRQTGCSQFVRLRQPWDGKSYALLEGPGPVDGPHVSRRRARKARRPSASEIPLIPYPEEDPVGGRLGLEGAGIMAYQTGDQMHPPMVDDERLWADAALWPEAAAAHTREAARLLELEPGSRVLDIGCGIGGPARLLVDEFDCRVHGIANAPNMLATAERINHGKDSWAQGISLEVHDCQEPFGEGGFDAAWSMNMIYRVPDKRAMLLNTAAALRPGGRLMIEDWLLTDSATPSDIALMEQHHQAPGMASTESMTSLLGECGFAILAEQDLGEVGRTHMAKHFVAQFDEHVRPRLESDFPDKPNSGRQMADEWVAGIEATIALYEAERMTYRRFVATTSG